MSLYELIYCRLCGKLFLSLLLKHRCGVCTASPARALALSLYAIAGFAAIVAAVLWYLTTEGRTNRQTDRQIDRKSYAIRTSDLRGVGSESGPARLRGQSLPSRSATGRAPSAFGFGCHLPSPRPSVPTECPTPRSEVRSAASDRRGTRRGRPRDGRGKRERGGEKFLLVCVAAVL